MDIMSRLLAELSVESVEDVRQWMGQNIRRIAIDIYSKALNAFHLGIAADYFQLPKNYFHRIVMHGRPGSGRRTLAHVLAERWNLLILDADALANHHINGHAAVAISIAIASRFSHFTFRFYALTLIKKLLRFVANSGDSPKAIHIHIHIFDMIKM